MNLILLGKPNVGKSSIYNILTGKNYNIVHKEEGTTRDWHRNPIKSIEKCFLYDTPGIIIGNNFNKNFNNNLIFKKIIKKIDVIIYVIDYNSIFDENDLISLNYLRKINKKIILIINKFDNFKKIPNIEYFKYGINDTFFVSCSHKYGFDKLKLYIKNNIIIKNTDTDLNHSYSLAIFGQPNVGKSTFINTILKYDRSKTSKISGTTSDIVTEYFKYKNNIIKIFDTAGIKKKSNITKNSLDYFSIRKSLNQITEVDVSILLFDSQKTVQNQDKKIIDIVFKKSKGIIIVFNKFDLIKNKILFKKNNIKNLQNLIRQSKNIKVFFSSAFKRSNVIKILDYINDNIFNKKIILTTGQLNKWLKHAILKKQHPLINGKKLKFKYAVQVKNKPIIIKIFCNYSNKIKNDYKRFLINNLIQYFRITNQKIEIIFSTSNNPYL